MRTLLSLAAVLAGIPLAADSPSVLADAVARWEEERHRWAFTQRVREWDGDRLVAERLERYDPNRGMDQRWRLLEVDGRDATDAERRALERRKNRPPRHSPKPIASHVDLERARALSEDDTQIVYQVPLRGGNDWIVPTGRIELFVTINKEHRAIERARVEIDGPFRVALGLARVMELELDLTLPPDEKEGEAAEPEGTAQAVVNRFGRRIEYTWSDFTRGSTEPEAPRP
ncbi:MAG TPA: hypothetical protein VEB66_01220 [Opitutaceae bacterium]|nr:hypothetical protein [Opitutaceae bacterium]